MCFEKLHQGCHSKRGGLGVNEILAVNLAAIDDAFELCNFAVEQVGNASMRAPFPNSPPIHAAFRRDHLAVVDDGDAVTQTLRFLDVVSRQQDGAPLFAKGSIRA